MRHLIFAALSALSLTASFVDDAEQYYISEVESVVIGMGLSAGGEFNTLVTQAPVKHEDMTPGVYPSPQMTEV